MMALAPRLMLENGVTGGFRTLVNTGPDGARKYRTSTCTSWAVPVLGEGLT